MPLFSIHDPARRRGFVFIDVVATMALVGLMLGLLVAGFHRYDAAQHRLGESRRAVRLAEQALADLRMGRMVKESSGDALIDVTMVNPFELDPRWQWVTVAITLNSRTTTLTGLVPAAGGTP